MELNQTDKGNSDSSTTMTAQVPEESIYSSVSILRCFLLVLSTLLLLTLNPFCLLVLRHVDNIQETTKVFLRSLSTADIGIGVFMAMPMMLSAFSDGWPLGDVLCGVQSLVLPILLYSSLLSLLQLTVDRYISIVHALRYSSIITMKRARIAVCCTWGMNAVIATVYGSLNDWIIIYDSETSLCGFRKQNQRKQSVGFLQATYSCVTLSSMLVVLLAYLRLFMISRHHARRINALNEQINHVDVADRRRPSAKSLHTVLIVVLTALILNLLPFVYANISVFSGHSIFLVKDVNRTFFLFGFPLLTNSWINVVIYYVRNREFREAAHTLVTSYYRLFKRFFQCQTN